MGILRKIKEKLSKIIQKAKKVISSQKITAQAIRPKKTPRAAAERPKEEAVLGAPETAVEKAKFYTGQIRGTPPVMSQELPVEYGEDKIVLQVRDPWWIHSYWEIQAGTWDRLKNELGDAFYKAKRILRVYDVSQIIFDGKNAHRFFDIRINGYANSWYIDTQGPGRSWCVDLGLLLADGRFITIVRSNTVSTPLDGPSWITDEEWMIPEDMFARLYGMGFGLGMSSPIGKAWQERVRRQLYSGAFISSGSPVKKSP